MLKHTTKPTRNQLDEIEKWLISEANELGEGFYCNWNIITRSFDNNQLWVTTFNDRPIGFVVVGVSDSSLTAVIDIAEIKPSERQKGYARQMINETLNRFRSQGVLVVRLECSPTSSEPFWKKMGFQNYPATFPKSSFHLYQTLVEVTPLSENNKTTSTISLWNCEPHKAARQEASWIWELDLLDDQKTLRKPIIFPVLSDWNIQFKDDHGTFSEKVKRFLHDQGEFEDFLIIRQLTA